MSQHVVFDPKDLVPWATDKGTKHSAAFKLFHFPFNFRISRLHLTDPRAIQLFGRLTTGNVESDRVMATEEVTIVRTIQEMVYFHREGISFRLVKPEDGLTIYEIVYEHLQDWRNEISNNVNMRDAPIDDLRALDEFAKEIYLIARGYIQYKPQATTISNFFEQLAASRGMVGSRAVDHEIEARREELHTSQHSSEMGFMARILRDRQRDSVNR